MGRAIIMHIDDAPWVHVNWLPGGLVAPLHSHDQDETIFILEGGFSMGRRRCGPGTVVYLEAHTQYGFEVWEEGVRFLNIRNALSKIRFAGEASSENPYEEEYASGAAD